MKKNWIKIATGGSVDRWQKYPDRALAVNDTILLTTIRLESNWAEVRSNGHDTWFFPLATEAACRREQGHHYRLCRLYLFKYHQDQFHVAATPGQRCEYNRNMVRSFLPSQVALSSYWWRKGINKEQTYSAFLNCKSGFEFSVVSRTSKMIVNYRRIFI